MENLTLENKKGRVAKTRQLSSWELKNLFMFVTSGPVACKPANKTPFD
jgi:hypothetical protein